jgi:hypothetical protein
LAAVEHRGQAYGDGLLTVSCHVERPLDARVWSAFAELQERRPGSVAVAALMRPPEEAEGESWEPWLARAREAAERAPFGLHTHWTGVGHARPTGGDPGARVLEQGRRLAAEGLPATLFCGGGWYSDSGVVEAVAELGYADCTPTAFRPPYLPPDAPRLALAEPATLRLDSGRTLLALPSTHSLGMAARAALTPLPRWMHVYFHDTDLVDRKRRLALVAALRVLGRRRRPVRLDEVAASMGAMAPELAVSAVAAA